MNKKRVTAILIFLFCVTIPILTLSLFPTPCGYGLCLLIYYPIIFLVGGLSAWTYYKFSDKIKFNKTIFLALILVLDLTLLTYFYPKSEYFPTSQLSVARQIANNYDNLQPIDILKATEDRNFLMITALYHKFKLPKETYNVSYCFIDTNGSCDTIYNEFHYFISDYKVVTDNSKFHYELDLKDGSFTFIDTVENQDFTFKVGYPNFGKYRKDFTNTSSDLSDKGERITGLVKDIGTLRVTVDETQPKFEYGFTRLFEKYLSLTK
jgi:hypothetical protein